MPPILANPYWMLPGIVLVGALLRLHHIGQASLWNDELFSRYYPETGLRYMWSEGFFLETNPPAYYTLLLGWMRLFGTGEVALRSISLLASLLAIPLTYCLAREFAKPGTALLAALLMAIFPMQIYYAQEARCYALMVLPVSLALLGMARYLRDLQARHLVSYALGAVGGVYVHTTGALIVVAFNLAFLLTFAGQSKLPAARVLLMWLAANAAVALLCVPELVAMLSEIRANRMSWLQAPTRRDVELALGTLITGPANYHQKVSLGLSFLLLVAMLAALATARPDRRTIAVLILVPAVEFGLILLAGLRQPLLVPRILCWMSVPLSVLLAVLIARSARVRSLLGAATALVLLTGVAIQLRQGAEAKEPWRLFFARLQPELANADIVAVGPWSEPMPLAYYGQDMAKARHWTEHFPDTVESTVIPKLLGTRDVTRDELLADIRKGARVLLLQRQVEFVDQKLLANAVAPTERVQQSCGEPDCLEALYWAATSSGMR